MQYTGTSIKAILLSVLMHIGIIALLVVSIDVNTRSIHSIKPEIVNAVAIDNQEVERELQKIRDIEDQKLKQQQETERKLQEAERKLADAEKKRQEEEKRLAQTRQRQEEERKKREEEQRKTAQLKKEQEDLERQRKAEEEKKRAAESEQARLAAEQKQRQEEERRRREQEEARQKQLAQERQAREAEQARQDQQFINSFTAEIRRRVSNNFNISGLPSGLKCEISVRVIPGGEIVNVSISRSSGNDIFDSRALTAVQKASPLPVPADAATLDRLRLRHFTFEFSP